MNNADTRGSFSNSFSTCIGLQIQLFISWLKPRQLKMSDTDNSTFHLEEYSTAQQSRVVVEHQVKPTKFTDLSNSIFLRESSRMAPKFSEGFTPYSLFSFYSWEEQLKSQHIQRKFTELLTSRFDCLMASVGKNYTLSRWC